MSAGDLRWCKSPRSRIGVNIVGHIHIYATTTAASGYQGLGSQCRDGQMHHAR